MIVPVLAYEADDAPWPEGDLIALPAPVGPTVTLRFPSPFESFLTLDGQRVLEERDRVTRKLLLWLGRRLPALWRALEDQFALRATVEGSVAGSVEGERFHIVVHELYELDGINGARLLDHGKARERLEPARVELPAYAVLGQVGTRAELLQRARTMFAAGTTIEVRAEENGAVLSRRRVRVGR